MQIVQSHWQEICRFYGNLGLNASDEENFRRAK